MQDETVGTALERHSSSSIPHCGVARSLAKVEPRAEAVEGWAVFVFPQALVQASEALIKPTRFDCLRGGRSLSLGALPDRRQCRGHVLSGAVQTNDSFHPARFFGAVTCACRFAISFSRYATRLVRSTLTPTAFSFSRFKRVRAQLENRERSQKVKDLLNE